MNLIITDIELSTLALALDAAYRTAAVFAAVVFALGWMLAHRSGRMQLLPRPLSNLMSLLKSADVGKHFRSQNFTRAMASVRSPQKRRADENDPHQNEIDWRALIQSAPDGFLLADQEFEILEVNQTLLDMCGVKSKQVVGRPLKVLLANAHYDHDQFASITIRDEFAGEVTVSLAGKPDRILEIKTARISPSRFIGIVRDITTRKIYESELQRAAELRELLLRNMNDGLAVIDCEGKVLINNRATESILGLSHQDLLNMSFLEAKLQPVQSSHQSHVWELRSLHGSELSEENNPFFKAIRQEKKISGHRLQICQSESPDRFVAVNISPLYDERNELVGVLATFRNVTAEVQTEIFRRSREPHIQQMARLAAIGELTTGAAHEMNNILSGIVSYAQMLFESENRRNANDELIRGIQEGSSRAVAILQNLMTFARLESEEFIEIRFQDILSSALRLVDYKISKDDIAVEIEMPEDLPMIECRSQQIQQVVLNLINNAHHALVRPTTAGRAKAIKITANAKRTTSAPSGDWMRVEIHDNGIGIDPENLAYIFDPFFTTKGRNEGTGLGLSISYSIVKDHGGEIKVESEPEVYTTFIIELPCKQINKIS